VGQPSRDGLEGALVGLGSSLICGSSRGSGVGVRAGSDPSRDSSDGAAAQIMARSA
jgi:hypothetical protein